MSFLYLQVEAKMECVELALKSSFRKKMSVNLSPQLRWDELGSSGVQNGVSCDDFSVDELLNFSNEDGFEGRENGEEENDDHKSFACVSVSPQELEDYENPNGSFSVTDGFGSLPTSELSVPTDDLADLEWLSHFVDDSFSEHSAPFPAGIWTGKPKQSELERETKAFTPPQPCFKTPIPAKARSKRPRTGGRVWVVGSSSLSESSSSSTTSSSSSSSPSSPLLNNTMVPLPDEIVFRYAKPPAKKPKIKSPINGNGGSGTTHTTRRCSHCGVQKTPQWRAGPLGAKTLCNACGVRYKSGRLLPEYRPACSPTFSSELHSNHHRRILEMRRKKVDPGLPEQGFTPPPVVPSF